MQSTTSKKLGAILSAVAILLIVLGFTGGTVLLSLVGESFLVLLIYGGIYLAIAIGVIIALVQRLKEIREGEEEEAKKY